MKGPYERLKYDLRRVWKCPDCHHHERSEGSVTSLVCRCQHKKEVADRVAMKLVGDAARRVDSHGAVENHPAPMSFTAEI